MCHWVMARAQSGETLARFLIPPENHILTVPVA
jgi:hypothetical protein